MHRLASRDTTEYDCVSHRVPAQAVSTVYAAGHFAGSVQAWNGIAIFVENLASLIGKNPTHCVVHARLNSIE